MVALEGSEVNVLVDTIDQALEGHKETKDLVISDPNIKSPEQLTDMAATIDENISTLKSIRQKVLNGYRRT